MIDLFLAFILLPLDSATALYAVLFAVLVLSGFGLPIPEEVTLILGGYLAYLEFVSFQPLIYMLILGVVAADTAGYCLGRFYLEWFYGRFPILNKFDFVVDRAHGYFEKYGEKVIFLSRPLVGVRFLVPILAGHFRMDFKKFLMYDIFAAVPWVVFLVSLSYYFGSGLDLITEIREIKHAIYIFIGIGIIIYTIFKFSKSIRENLKL